MTIQVTCPNASCAKVLSVQETYAGKKGMCPACGSELMIPAAPRSDSGAGRRTPEPRGRLEDNEPTKRLPAGAPVRPIDDDYAYDKRREGARSNVINKPAAGAMTRFALAIGIGALCLLAFSPRMHWIYISKSNAWKPTRDVNPRFDEEEALGNEVLKETLSGIDFLHVSLGIAGLALVALACTPTQMRDLANGAIAASGSAAVGWGLLAGIWQLALVWKVITINSTRPSPQWNPGFQSYDSSIYPGPGLGFGLVAAFMVVLVFGALASCRGRFLWVFTAGLFGFIIGILMLVVSVKPWA
jgi:hypothetical protein